MKSPDRSPGHPSKRELQNLYREFINLLAQYRDSIIGTSRDARYWDLGRGGVDLQQEILRSIQYIAFDYSTHVDCQRRDELLQIQSALDRMQRGLYGICEGCTKTMSIEHLRKIPYARQCSECAPPLEEKPSLQ